MENIIKRHWNLSILAAVLFVQLIGLAYQVKTPVERGSTRLIRVWAVSMITPFEKGFVHSVDWVANGWHNYLYLRNVRKQNEQLRARRDHREIPDSVSVEIGGDDSDRLVGRESLDHDARRIN